jgi:hypothetical protein
VPLERACGPNLTLSDLQRNNKLVWDETVEIMEDLFRDVWGYKESVTVDNALDITFQVRELIYGASGQLVLILRCSSLSSSLGLPVCSTFCFHFS